ncbi:MAG: LrgB family protein [Lachnospiraceae bacterium]
MNFNILANESTYFGVVLTMLIFLGCSMIQKKWKNPILNPLLLSIIIIIIILNITDISYDTYQNSAKILTYFLTPATVCLAIPLYKQWQILKDNVYAIVISIVIGCIAHALTIIGLMTFAREETFLILSLLSKSVTTAIALDITKVIGGISSITVIGITIAGISGSVFGPVLIKLFRIKEPIAQGIALGSASHAIGTSRAIELGEIQAAMGSLSIVVTGVLTVIIVPIIAKYL